MSYENKWAFGNRVNTIAIRELKIKRTMGYHYIPPGAECPKSKLDNTKWFAGHKSMEEPSVIIAGNAKFWKTALNKCCLVVCCVSVLLQKGVPRAGDAALLNARSPSTYHVLVPSITETMHNHAYDSRSKRIIILRSFYYIVSWKPAWIHHTLPQKTKTEQRRKLCWTPNPNTNECDPIWI